MCAVEIKKTRRPVGSVKDMDITPNWEDPEFCQLYQRYINAYRNYMSELRRRREIRARYAEQRKYPRRPVGSPKGFKIPAATSRRPVTPVKRKPLKVDMGKILGVVTFNEYSPDMPEDAEADALFKSLYDQVQLNMFHAAKRRFKDAILGLVKYQVKHHRAEAKSAARHAVNLQLLGADDGMETELRKMQESASAVLDMAVEMYRADPRPGTLRFVLEAAAEGQLVGLDESGSMEEVSNLLVEMQEEGKINLNSSK